jgi:hypothetical protein
MARTAAAVTARGSASGATEKRADPIVTLGSTTPATPESALLTAATQWPHDMPTLDRETLGEVAMGRIRKGDAGR